MFTYFKLREIKKNILLNEGGTLVPGSFKNLNKQDGYMVALAGYEKIINIDDLSIQTIKEYNQLAINNGGYIGFWIDKNTNLLYLDISLYINNKYRALATARKNKQLAIFDLKNKDSIYL